MAVLAIAIVIAFAVIAAGTYFAIQPTVELKNKLAVVTSSSPTDLSWTAASYDGMMHIKDKYGWEVDMTEFVSYADAERVIRDYAARGFKLVWGHGAQYEDGVIAVAPDFPNTYFVVTAGTKEDPPANVITMNGQRREGSYLLGALAAMITKTNKVASIGGVDYPVVIRDHEAFKAGVKAINPDLTATTIYAGTWADPVKGRQLATTLIEQGYDVIWAQADLTNRGIIEACRDANIPVFGTDYDTYPLAPPIVVSTVLMKMDRAMEIVVEDILAEKFQGGRCWEPGLKEGVFDLAPYHDWEDQLSQEFKGKIEQMKQDIIAGTIVPPTIFEKTD